MGLFDSEGNHNSVVVKKLQNDLDKILNEHLGTLEKEEGVTQLDIMALEQSLLSQVSIACSCARINQNYHEIKKSKSR